MEQNNQKTEMIVLVTGLILAVTTLFFHYFSRISRQLAKRADIEIVVLEESGHRLLVYKPSLKTVDVFVLPAKSAGSTGSNYQKAHEVASVFSKNSSGVTRPVPYVLGAGDAVAGKIRPGVSGAWRTDPGALLNIAQAVWKLKTGELTNLSWHDLLLICLEMLKLNSSNYVITDPSGGFFEPPRNAGEERPVDDKSSTEPERILRAEVFNASGKKDLAVKVTKFLRKQGVDVINFGTYPDIKQQTKIVNCSNNISAAGRIRDILGLEKLEIYSKYDKLKIADVIIIIGSDFDADVIK